MKIIVCLSDGNGMGFNNRRQSQDSALIDWIIRKIFQNNLYISPYSESLFLGKYQHLYISDDFLKKASKEDYCFVENIDYLDYKEDINGLIICRWNRAYPYDMKFELALDDYSLISTNEITGTSHERITIEEWQK